MIVIFADTLQVSMCVFSDCIPSILISQHTPGPSPLSSHIESHCDRNSIQFNSIQFNSKMIIVKHCSPEVTGVNIHVTHSI